MHTLAGNVQLAWECRQKSQFIPHCGCDTHFMESLLLFLAQSHSSQVDIDINTTVYVMQRFNQVIKI